MRRCLVLVLALLAAQRAHAQPIEAIAESSDDEPISEDTELGAVVTIEAITVRGNTATLEDIIRLALPIAPGDVLKQSDSRLRDARFKLLGLGYFRDVTIAMRKGTARGQVIIDIVVVERGTFVLDKLWFGRTAVAPYWLGVDVGDRNLLGLGISAGVAAIYAAPSAIKDAREQWAVELRLADGSLRGSRWGASGSLTLVHGSDFYRTSGEPNATSVGHFRGFAYRRFGGRWGATYDVTKRTRLSAQVRLEAVNTQLPSAPSRTLPDGRDIRVDLHLDPGESRVVTAGFGYDRDTRSDPILPHTGGRLTAAIELGSSAIASDYDFATVFARFEHWWPLRDQRHTIGMRIAGGLVLGDAPRFDRIHIADVNRMLTPRALGLVLSNAAPLEILNTRNDKPTIGEVGGIASIEYAAQLFRGTGRRRVYGGDFFFGAGLWALAETDGVPRADASVWRDLPVDLYIDAGVRIDTDLGIFELTVANALGRLR